MEHNRRRAAIVSSETTTAEPRGGRTAEDSSFSLLRDNIIEAIRILALRRWAFFVPFCVVTCIATVASHWIPRTFRSTTIIERRDHPVLMNLRQTAATGGFAHFFRPTLVRDLTSLDMMTEVVERLGIVADLSRNPDGSLTDESRDRCRAKAALLVGGMSARLVERTEHFDQIQITYTGPDPALPQRLVNQMKDIYIRGIRNKLTEMLTEGSSYFNNVAEEQRDTIAALEEDLLTFQAKYIGIDPTNPGALKLKLTSLESERSELEREIATSQREIAARERLLEAYKRRSEMISHANAQSSLEIPAMAKSAEAQTLETEIRKLQQEIHEMQLVRRMTELHPDVVERRTRIERLRENLKAQYLADVRSLPANRGVSLNEDGAYSAVESAVGWDVELAGMQMDLQDRISRLESTTGRLRVVEDDIAKHETLEANVFQFRKEFQLKSDVLNQTRDGYNENTRRAVEIASILNADESERGISFTELTRPTPCLRPVSPRGVTVLVLSILAGLAAGAVSVLLKELFDQKYHTTKQVSRSLGLAILESVDEIVTSVDRATMFRRRAIYSPAVVAFLLLAVGVTCAAAFASLERPSTYKRLMRVPTSIWQRVSDTRLFASHGGAPDHHPIETRAGSAQS